MRRISAKELKVKLEENNDLIILDIREQEDYDGGHIKGAMVIGQNEVSHEIEDIVPDKDTDICVYCYSGNRSRRVAMMLDYLGYTQVYDLGGIDSWTYELEKNK